LKLPKGREISRSFLRLVSLRDGRQGIRVCAFGLGDRDRRRRELSLRGPVVHDYLSEWLFLPVGEYTATWHVDDAPVAPTVFFAVGDSQSPAVWPPRIDGLGPRVGVPREPDFLLRFGNPGDSDLNLLSALGGATLIVDGNEYPYELTKWDGCSDL